MTEFSALALPARALILTGFTIALMLLGCALCIRVRRTRRISLLLGLPAAAMLALLVLLLGVQYGEVRGQLPGAVAAWIGRLPFGACVLIAVCGCALGAAGGWRELRRYQTMLTPRTIREALHNLPDGLCFSDPNGMPLLVNRRMHQAAQCVTGQVLQNVEEFWSRLEKGTVRARRLPELETPTFLCPDGRVLRFEKRRLEIEDRRCVQVTVSDITQQYQLAEELREKNEALTRQHARLQTLLSNIVQRKHDEEVLAAKMRLHGQLGRCVLTTRRALVCGAAQQQEESAALWRTLISGLRTGLDDAQDETDIEKEQWIAAAAAMGCTLVFSGALPEEKSAAYLILSAAREAVTNAVRHAGADRVTVRTYATAQTYYAEIFDNGRAHGAIHEGGGLGNLRARIEGAGGELTITCAPGVRLHIRLKREGEA